jgi:putative SOS response-associated peptidase YedK
MCYYSSISVGFKIIETRFGVKFVQHELFQPVYSASAFTFPLMPVITNENPTQAVLMNWGLIPFWIKDNETALRIKQNAINARSETIFDKPMFKQSIRTKRCLVLVDGFFEWRHLNNKRYPYYIRLSDHQPFALAGIWDKWQSPERGTGVETFSVITTRANALLAQIHNTRERMPVILPAEKEKRWIDNNLEQAEIESMLKPYSAEEMEAYPVDMSISRLGFNTGYPNVLNKEEYTDLPDLMQV